MGQAPVACLSQASPGAYTSCNPSQFCFINCSPAGNPAGTNYELIIYGPVLPTSTPCGAIYSPLYTQNNPTTGPGTNICPLFTNPGAYSVLLVAKNGALTDTSTCLKVIIWPKPVVNFSTVTNDTFDCDCITGQLIDNSTPGEPGCPLVSRIWTIPNSIGTQGQPTISPVPFNYCYDPLKPICNDVSLLVTDCHGCISALTKHNYICTPKTPTASFVATTPVQACNVNSLTVSYQNTSVVAPNTAYTYKWYKSTGANTIFSNIPISTAQNPSITFTGCGCHSVKLVVEDALYHCKDSMVMLSSVCIFQITAGAPNATPTSICTGQQICFGQSGTVSCPTTNAFPPLQANWTITPTGANAANGAAASGSGVPFCTALTNTGSAGNVTYTASYQACNPNYQLAPAGCCSNSSSTTVTVTPGPTAAISVNPNPFNACQFPDTITLTNNSTGPVTGWCWQVVPTVGVNQISGTLCNTPPCTGGSASIKYAITSGSCHQFILTACGNGCTAVNSYTACVTLPNDSIKVTILNKSCRMEDSVMYTVTNPVAGTQYCWNFGDNPTHSLSYVCNMIGDTVYHTYADTGCYPISMVSTNAAGCTDTVTLTGTNKIKINLKLKPTISTPDTNICIRPGTCLTMLGNVNFPVIPTGSCINCSVKIIMHDTSASMSQGWLTPVTANNDTVIVTYNDPGVYCMMAVVECGSGTTACRDTSDCVYVTVKGPVVNFNGTVSCGNLSVPFKADTARIDTFCRNVYLWKIKKLYSNWTAGYSLADSAAACANPLQISPYPFIQWDTSNYFPGIFNYTFPDTGTYEVSLVVMNCCTGCFNSKTKIIGLSNGNAAFTKSPNVSTICNNGTITYNAAPSTGAASYCWKVYPVGTPAPGGCNYNTVSPSIIFNPSPPSDMVVQLIITTSKGCKDSIGDTIHVVNMDPHFYVNTSQQCFPLNNLVLFDTSATNGLATYTTMTVNWGGGNAPTVQTFNNVVPGTSHTHNYNQPTDCNLNANITVAITYGNGCSSNFTVPTAIKPICVGADFVCDTLVCPGQQVCFTNTTANGVAALPTWYFCPGQPGNIPMPSPPGYTGPNSGWPCPQNNRIGAHTIPCLTYNTQGNYNIYLVCVGPSYCRDTAMHTIHVFEPIANLSVTDTFFPCYPAQETVHLTFTGAVDSFYIDFGDGTHTNSTGSVAQVPPTYQHYYIDTGTYYLHLQVFSNTGCYDDTIIGPVIVSGPSGVINALDTLGCSCDIFHFNLCTNSTGTPLFLPGNGPSIPLTGGVTANGSTCYNFTHTYCTTGIYYPQVFISDSSGCVVGKNYHRIVINQPTAKFEMSDSLFCGSGTVTFSDSSMAIFNPITTWSWNFGDPASGPNNTSTLQNPSHTFNSVDTFTIRLIVNNIVGCKDTFYRQVYVKSPPTASFTNSIDTICIGGCVTFTNTSVNPDPAKGYFWNFGDPLSGAANFSHATNPTHCYSNPGTFQATLYDTTTYGCIDSFLGPIVTVFGGINSGFYVAPKDSMCATSFTFTFIDTSHTLTALSYCWIFGDPSSGLLDTICTGIYQNKPDTVQHTYTMPPGGGCYTITQIIHNAGGCSDTSRHSVCLYPTPLPDFSSFLNPLNACPPAVATFNDLSTPSSIINYWCLNFGDPVQATTCDNPSPSVGFSGIQHTYNNPTQAPITYTATLILNTAHGCADTVTRPITINPTPIADAGPDNLICPGDFDTIGPLTIPLGYTCNWICPFPPPVGCNPQVSPSSVTTYCLVVTNQYGCTDTDQAVIDLKPITHAFAGRDSAVCVNEPVRMYVVGGTTYQWDSKHHQVPANQVNLQSIVVTPFISDTFIVHTTGNCVVDSPQIYITVHPDPVITLEPSVQVLGGQPYQIATVGLGSVTWSPPTGLSCTDCPNPIATPEETTTYFVLLRDRFGCEDTARITINILCDKGNAVYMPNAFAPIPENNGQRNGYFYPQGRGVRLLKFMHVYNRWGEMVFNAQNVPINRLENGWDGTFKGKPMPADVYMWQAEFECSTGEKFSLNGNVTLIR